MIDENLFHNKEVLTKRDLQYIKFILELKLNKSKRNNNNHHVHKSYLFKDNVEK